MSGPNQDQQLLIVEQATKERFRKHFRRKFAGFDGISRRTPQPDIGLYGTFSTAEFVAAAERKDVSAMKAHKMLCDLSHVDLVISLPTGRWRANHDVCAVWAQEVIDSLHRCGLPFVDDRESMGAARLKANAERARRRELMRDTRRT